MNPAGWGQALLLAANLTVAAASDLQSALPAIAAQFDRDTGTRTALAFGSSGNLFAEIRNGAPFDLFLSADIDYARRLTTSWTHPPSSRWPRSLGSRTS
jgi:molybdate transport system substrate-binding protein